MNIKAEENTLIKELWSLADQLSKDGYTDGPVHIALAIEQMEELQAENERLKDIEKRLQPDCKNVREYDDGYAGIHVWIGDVAARRIIPEKVFKYSSSDILKIAFDDARGTIDRYMEERKQ